MVSVKEKERYRIQTEYQILNHKIGFSAAYLDVQYLYAHIRTNPEFVTKQTVTALLSLIRSKNFDSRKQAFFLFKEAACALVQISTDIKHPLACHCIIKLQDILLTSIGKKHRAVSEALGSLPVNITGPDIQNSISNDSLKISFKALLNYCETPDIKSMQWHGRTLRFKAKTGKIGCIKFATSKKNATLLMMEAHWLIFLKENPPCQKSMFKIPTPVILNNRILFKLTEVPDLITNNQRLSNEYLAIIFFAEKEYFDYPNEPDPADNQSASLIEIFSRNAWLLGKLTGKGIIHTALIPLFHNRVQQSRREDRGVYQWEQGGRLDKWLESSRYPNFAKSGLRDFEHLISIKTTKRLHHFIGEHILGFILVAGSFFRNKAPEKIGFDEKGYPVDSRDLFDKSLFLNLFKDIVKQYYQGVTGMPLKKTIRFLNDGLVDSLIEKMGIDHHMEETLRIQDQNNMSETDFDEFLLSRGYGATMFNIKDKGKNDIVLNTGPHLGGFNQPISVPELIDFLFCLSSLCISDRYIMENGLKASAN